MILRILQSKIETCFFKGKVVIIYGARQVGKTTLIKEIQKKYQETSLYLNADEPDIRGKLSNVTSTELKILINNKKVIFIDEAQRIKNIGITLKLFTDNFPDLQVIATGSSSLDLVNDIVEPLTGRKYEFLLLPFSISELLVQYSKQDIKRLLARRIIFGMYPEIEEKPGESEILLKGLASSYLYKDILQYQDLRNPELLDKLLKALALQIGQEVSFTELATLLGVNKYTVARYVELLEKTFVIFRLRPFSRNLRNELTKMHKIYFYDTGIRNALINNFNPPDLRQDIGSLWENFIISERMKYNNNYQRSVNTCFWRTYQQQEIDYLEEEAGRLTGFEIKWQNKKVFLPRIFLQTYQGSRIHIIHNDNFFDFITLPE